jgi:hypothetical protein
MKRAFLFAFLLSACDASDSISAVAAVGISGNGPHQGIVQEKQGSKVELVPMPDGTVRAYLADTSGQPQKATGEVKMTISADAFSPTEVIMSPAEEGAYLVGTLPGPAPTAPANVSLAFPAGVNFQYQAVPFAIVAAPSVSVATPTIVGVPASFVAPHKGSVTRVGDSLVEVVIMPKGEVQTYAYTLDAQPISVAEISIPEIEIQYQKKPYKVKMKAHASQPYLVGYIDAKISIPAHAEVIVVCSKPVKIKGIFYEPSVIVFAPLIIVTPIVVISPIVITPFIPGGFIEVGYGHNHKGSHKGSHKGYGSKHGGKHGGKHKY